MKRNKKRRGDAETRRRNTFAVAKLKTQFVRLRSVVRRGVKKDAETRRRNTFAVAKLKTQFVRLRSVVRRGVKKDAEARSRKTIAVARLIRRNISPHSSAPHLFSWAEQQKTLRLRASASNKPSKHICCRQIKDAICLNPIRISSRRIKRRGGAEPQNNCCR